MTRAIDDLPDLLDVPRTDAVYNAHGYLTKVPVAAITPFLEALSRPGEVILDPFAGSGMVGIAAATTGRRAILSDLSVLGRHIARGYLEKVDPDTLRSAADTALEAARKALGNLYQTTRREDGQPVELRRTVWSAVYRCPACREELVYHEALIEGDGTPPETCHGCGGPFSRRRWPRVADQPVLVVVMGARGRLVEQPIADVDLQAIARAEIDPRRQDVPSRTIEPEREMAKRSALVKHGLTETHRFFSARNALALLTLWRAIDDAPTPALRQKLRFAFTAVLLRASRRYQWGPKRPLNAQAQTYYIAAVHYEWNVFDLFRRKIEAVIRADRQIDAAGKGATRPEEISYVLASADDLSHLDDESVDYAFTDPPFGGNIFYSDMNLFHEAWLGKITDPEREAVVRKGPKGEGERYEALLRGAFAEIFRVLRAGRFLSVVFGNSRGEIWVMMQRALRAAGFEQVPAHVAILDKGQRSVKGLASGSERVVTVDLVLTVRKPTLATAIVEPLRHISPGELISRALKRLDEASACNPSHLYAATLREAMVAGRLVDDLHLADVLTALRRAGYVIDRRTGLLTARPSRSALRAAMC